MTAPDTSWHTRQLQGTGLQPLPTDLLGDWDAWITQAGAGNALMYLIRRFGPAQSGSDPFKDVCLYLLTTPDPEVVFSVRIGLQPSGGVFASPDLAAAADRISRVRPDARQTGLEQIRRALRAGVADLLRPVPLRRARFNLHGEVQPDPQTPAVDPFVLAGIGVPADFAQQDR